MAMSKHKPLFTQDQINADIALKARLYVSGYQLSHVLRGIRDGGIIGKVALHHDEGNTPVGVAVHITDRSFIGYETMVFVRKSKRRQGIGSLLIKQLNSPKNSFVGRGCSASRPFWKKHGYLMDVC